MAAAAVSREEVRASFRSMILSASGWRKVFAEDGDESSGTPRIQPADAVIACAAAAVFSRFMQETYPGADTLVIASDSRPTGEALALPMLSLLLRDRWKLQSLGIAAIPEVIAYNIMHAEIHGGVYISASHNPVGHNGLKFFSTAGVIGGEHSRRLIDSMVQLINDDHALQQIIEQTVTEQTEAVTEIKEAAAACKLKAEDAYRQFIGITASDSSCICGQDDLYSRIREGLARQPLSVVIDFNGSARAAGIDRQFLTSLGAGVIPMHETPGDIAHGILPEGDNLLPCCRRLEEAWRRDPSCCIGMVPDNDGDRGNIVYTREDTGRAVMLQAQEVFALVVMAELVHLYTRSPGEMERTAVAVNCATSMRIDEIARRFGAKVFRAEVGEANAVTLAEELRRTGYVVRVLGEGSNGGNITHPSVVRDPLNTLMSIMKLLTIQDTPGQPGLFRQWLRLSGREESFRAGFTLEDVLASLPCYSTTETADPRALVRLSCGDQGAFKLRYEQAFLEAWNRDRDTLFRQLNIASWREFNTEGSSCTEGTGAASRSAKASGGLRIVFYDPEGTPTDFIWMRKSGTEPVFRIMADSRGNNMQRCSRLLAWHREIISEAENG